jgi:hypothetical protein
MMPQLLADSILVMHAIFIAFVIVGFVLVLIGMFRRWGWIRNLWFRLIHLLAIGFVVADSWLGGICPLTEWESRLREAAGGVGYSESFVQHWLHKVVFYDFAPWFFTVAYTVFGILVLLAWILVPPRFSRR